MGVRMAFLPLHLRTVLWEAEQLLRASNKAHNVSRLQPRREIPGMVTSFWLQKKVE